MKKLLPVIFIVLVFAGCKKNSTPPDPNADATAKIIGKWKDGPELDIFYTAGKEVFRQAYSAPTTVSGYYEFTSAGVLNLYLLNGTASTLYTTFGYSITNSGATLHLTQGTSFGDNDLSFIDSNTLTITSTNTSGVTYVSNGVTLSADKEVDQSTLIRFN